MQDDDHAAPVTAPESTRPAQPGRGPRYGFHASHEQIPPSRLLRDVQHAERAGFDLAMCSDHFTPWSTAQGESGFAWSWLGAAMATTSLPFGIVNAPGFRYHPAIIAQAAATLAEMFPGRFSMALGTGQAMNEHIVAERWPSKPERKARLLETVAVMRALFAGEEVSHHGLIRVDRAVLWTRPEQPPPLFGAAITPDTARWAGQWADGLITVNQPDDVLREVFDAFRDGGGQGKPIRVQLHLSWAESLDAARALAHRQWAPAVLGSDVGWLLETPADFERAASFVRPEDMDRYVVPACEIGPLAERVAGYVELGADEVYLHHVGQQQQEWLEVAATLLPQLPR